MIKDDAPILVTLDQIMADYDGTLDSFMTAQPDAQNILIHWSVSVDVKGQGQQAFQVGVAVCFTELLAEEAKDQLAQIADPGTGLVLPIFLPGSTARKTLESLLSRPRSVKF